MTQDIDSFVRMLRFCYDLSDEEMSDSNTLVSCVEQEIRRTKNLLQDEELHLQHLRNLWVKYKDCGDQKKLNLYIQCGETSKEMIKLYKKELEDIDSLM